MPKRPPPPFREGSSARLRRATDPGRASGSSAESSFDAEARRDESPSTLPDAPPCPFCEGTQTEIMSAFGSHASVSTYWCRACGSPFELMKWRGGGRG
jgi:hypothetical protein